MTLKFSEPDHKNPIVDESNHYLYRHVRLDLEEVFYIGVGTKCHRWNPTSIFADYKRAFCSKYRNRIWKGIVSKTEYRVEILLESDNYDFILEKEKEFISLYGRKDLGTGTLANLTDGGDGMINLIRTKEHNQKISEAHKGKACSEKARNYWKYNNPSKRGKENTQSKPLYQYDLEGNFIKKWDCGSDAKRKYGTMITIKRKTCYNFQWFTEYKGEQIKARKRREGGGHFKKIVLIDKDKNELLCFSIIKNASIELNVPVASIQHALKTGGSAYGYYFKRIQ